MAMTKIKTSELTKVTLDWAVAKCETLEVEYINDGITRCLLRVSPFTSRYSPSTDWAQGGPIIEREKISLERDRDLAQTFEHWVASKHQNHYMISETH